MALNGVKPLVCIFLLNSIALLANYVRVASWCCGRLSRVRVSAGHHGVKTLGKFLTPMCSVTKQYNLVPVEGRWRWEGNRRSGDALAMCHRHSGLSTYGLKGLRKGDEHPVYAQRWVRHLYLTQLCHSGWKQTYNVRKMLSPSYSFSLLAITDPPCSAISPW